MIQISRLTGLLLVLAALALPALAQDTTQTAPPGLSAPSASSPAAEPNSSQQLQPDTHPLAGAYLYTLGSALEGRNYLQPEFSIGEMGTNNPEYISNTQSQWVMATLPEVSLLLVHASKRNEIAAGYLGGGFIYNNSRFSSADATFQSLNLSDTVQFRRLTLTLADMFSYLPNGAPAFGGVGGLGGISPSLPGGAGLGGLGQINPMFASGQSILTNLVGAYNNNALIQAEYALTARTSFTAMGSYGTLQAGNKSAGFLSENSVMGSGGLEHRLNRRDTVGVSYYYSAFHYVGLPQSFSSNSVDLDYGRKITGRLALQLYAGPEVVTSRFGKTSLTQVLASGYGDLTYARGRNNYSLSGGRYSTGGSGVIAGSDTETIGAGWSRQLTRKWSSYVSGGLVRNSEFATPGVLSAIHYDYWDGGLSLTRVVSRRVSIYLDYSYQRQLTNAGTCTASLCAANLTGQVAGIGLIFTPRPVGL
jgi:hypothetical protein